MDCHGKIPSIFGKILRKMRQQAGLPQDKFAELVGIDKSYVSLLEQGKRQPSIVILMKLAKALDVLPEDIMREVRLELQKAFQPAGAESGD